MPPTLEGTLEISRVCVAGVTGWTGRAVAEAILDAQDLELVAGVSRGAAGTRVHGAPVFSSVELALAEVECDVLIDYTHPTVAAGHAHAAIVRGMNVVIGTSGISEADFSDLERLAEEHSVAVAAAGNFSPLAGLLGAATALVASYAKRVEIVEYGSAVKPDAPSTTARDIIRTLRGRVEDVNGEAPIGAIGDVAARGALVEGVPVHSVRLPTYLASVDVVLASPYERLTLRYEPGGAVDPYVDGTLIAVRTLPGWTGLRRGLTEIVAASETSST